MPGLLPNVVTEASSGLMLELAVAASLLTLLWMSAQARTPRPLMLRRTNSARRPRRINQDPSQGG
jgi:hypothetical protein